VGTEEEVNEKHGRERVWGGGGAAKPSLLLEIKSVRGSSIHLYRLLGRNGESAPDPPSTGGGIRDFQEGSRGERKYPFPPGKCDRVSHDHRRGLGLVVAGAKKTIWGGVEFLGVNA